MARAVSKAMVALAPDYGMTEDAAALRLAATCEVLAGIGATDDEVEAAVMEGLTQWTRPPVPADIVRLIEAQRETRRALARTTSRPAYSWYEQQLATLEADLRALLDSGAPDDDIRRMRQQIGSLKLAEHYIRNGWDMAQAGNIGAKAENPAVERF